MADLEITCSDCSTPFSFTESEQQFFAEKGFTSPKRCRACRQNRKQGGGGGGGDRSGGGGGYGGGGGDRMDREKFDAICAECGTATQVPFKPKEDRPVFCRDCYKLRSPR